MLIKSMGYRLSFGENGNLAGVTKVLVLIAVAESDSVYTDSVLVRLKKNAYGIQLNRVVYL